MAEKTKPNQQTMQTPLNWHERAAFQQSAFRRSTAGNDVVAILGPMATIFDLGGGVALQEVSECPFRH